MRTGYFDIEKSLTLDYSAKRISRRMKNKFLVESTSN